MKINIKHVRFIAIARGEDRDGEAGWVITVDGVEVAEISNTQMDISDNALKSLWKVLGCEVTFDYEA